MEYKQPIIICGMHRSGTSLISRLIESQGVFMGHKKQGDNESTFFIDINEAIFKLVNASWDNPSNFYYTNQFFDDNIGDIITKNLNSRKAIEYFGYSRYLINHNFHKIKYPWGWKDPRNTFTLDYWKALFPSAKIIHVYRNPIDVANSMRTRQQNFMENFDTNEAFRKYCMRINFFGTSYRCLDLNEGFKIWENYISKAFETIAGIYHIKYEEVLRNPENLCKELIKFIEIPINIDTLNAEIARIDKSRQFAFLGDNELEDFYLRIKNNNWLKKLGYKNII